ncbi:MAG: MBL fold metallo-hydrolase, partial [Betaproteobacteria bacterium]|nr:MBL fold metallo-hydrolase [Betaproteobacteria bacterium]
MQYALRNILGMLGVLALVAGCATPPRLDAGTSGNIEVWWLGQAAMRITTASGKVIMIDPWIMGNPKTPAQYKNLDALGKIDLLLVTHAHGDHLGDAVAL